jgi:hypothetical protein
MILFALGQTRIVLALGLSSKGLIPFKKNIFHINTSYNPYSNNVGRYTNSSNNDDRLNGSLDKLLCQSDVGSLEQPHLDKPPLLNFYFYFYF